MFDIGFSELMIIAVVALIVIGPERLPKVARTLGHLFGRMQRYVSDVKADISREMELDELKKLQTTMEDAARSFEQSVTQEVQSAESELSKIAQEANPVALPFPTIGDGSAATSDTIAQLPAAQIDGRPAPSAVPSAQEEASSQMNAEQEANSRMDAEQEVTSQMELELGSSSPPVEKRP
jgi:sec-independent protein translocase protein TatB